MIRGLEQGKKAALIINELQRGVIDPSMTEFPGLAQQVAEKRVVANVAALARAFRARNLPVFHTHVVLRPDVADLLPNTLIMARARKTRAVVAGSAAAETVPELLPLPEDFVMPRSAGLGVFYGTALDATLRRLGIATIVITGVSSNVALSGLALGGTDRGYQVVMPDDCAAGASAEAHAQMLTNQLSLLATISSKDEIIAALG